MLYTWNEYNIVGRLYLNKKKKIWEFSISNSELNFLGKKNTSSKGYKPPDVYSSIIYYSQITEIAQLSISWWTDEEEVVCIQYNITEP